MVYNKDCNTCPELPKKPANCGCCENNCGSRTKYYGLPLWRATDVTSWMVGINGAMEKIDCLFHNFALRTGIDGIPEEIVTTVTKLQVSVTKLEKWQCTAIEESANITKVLADTLAQLDLINEKLRQLVFNYNNVDTRMKSAETSIQTLKDEVGKITENLNTFIGSVTTELEEVTAKITELETTTGDHTTRIEACEQKDTDIESQITVLEARVKALEDAGSADEPTGGDS